MKITQWACRRNVILSIENPHRSWLWTVLLHLVREAADPQLLQYYAALQDVEFANCMHAGTRLKITRWRSTATVFSSLQLPCDGNHEHDPYLIESQAAGWRFDTASEAAYPQLLASRAATCVARALDTTHLPPRVCKPAPAALGVQHKKHRALIPEYLQILSLPPHLPLPPLAKDLSCKQRGERAREDRDTRETDKGSSREVGIYHTPEQFVEKALKLQRPMDSANPLWECAREALQIVKESTPEALKLLKKKNLLKAKILQRKLAEPEKELHAGLHPSIQKVVADKNILLWQQLLESHGFDNMGVVDLLKEGTRLVGTCPKPDCFEPKVRPAALSEEQLRASAVWRRRALLQSRRTALSSSPDHVAHLDAATEEEVQLGFMEGPFSEAQVTEKLGHPNWCIIRRFILDQGGGKLRPIDEARPGITAERSVHLDHKAGPSDLRLRGGAGIAHGRSGAPGGQPAPGVGGQVPRPQQSLES